MTNLLQRILGSDDNAEERRSGGSSFGNDRPDEPAVEPLHISDAEFEQVILQSGKPAVIDLWAEWCAPCHMIAPAVQNLAAEYDGRAIIAKLNVDENPVTPSQYSIMGIPTLLFFKDGKLADQQVGVAGYAQLANKLEALLD